MRRRVADEILDVAEALLKAQLDAVRGLRKGKGASVSGPDEEKHIERRSQIGIAYEVLKKAGRPLHVNEIIASMKEQHGVTADRDSLVSAITKKVVRGEVFARTGRNTFSLREEADEP